MKDIIIKKIEIDEEGQLVVTPEIGADYYFIYRTASGVNWSQESHCLYSPKPKKWSYVDWFENIYASIKSEYEHRLLISAVTIWHNVNSDLKNDLIRSAAEIEEKTTKLSIIRHQLFDQQEQKKNHIRLSNQVSVAFKNKDFKKVVNLLGSTNLKLSPTEEKKLNYALNQLKK